MAQRAVGAVSGVASAAAAKAGEVVQLGGWGRWGWCWGEYWQSGSRWQAAGSHPPTQALPAPPLHPQAATQAAGLSKE